MFSSGFRLWLKHVACMLKVSIIMAVWLGCLGAMLDRRVLHSKRTDTYGKRNYNLEYTLLPLLYAVPKEEKGHTVREGSITICSIGFDIISSSLLYMQWYKLVTQSVGRSLWLIRSLTSYDGNCNHCDVTLK